MSLMEVGLIVENGSFVPQNLAADVSTAGTQVFELIGFMILAAIAVGILYAIWLLLTQGN